MAKRFIDTEIFEDPFFMDLSKDGKLFYIYCITRCNHAGIIELNEKLCQFQTGVKSLVTVRQELGNRLVSLNDGFYFLPKFIKFQYPNFPNSNVKQQQSAIEILKKFKLYDNSKGTLREDLGKDYDNVSDIDIDIDNGTENENVPFQLFINLFNEIKRSNFKGDEKAERQFKQRIKGGATLDDFEQAITNCMSDPFHKENPNHLTPEFITRSDKLEKYLNYQAPKLETSQNKESSFD